MNLRQEGGRLVLTDAAGAHGVEPVRAFPLSAPREGVSLCDGGGKELLWIESLDAVEPEARRLIEERLAQRAFVPVLRRVLAVSSAVEPSEWEVETDRGRTRFVLKNEDDVHLLDDHAALITDAHGIRYLIADVRGLDGPSRRLLERFL